MTQFLNVIDLQYASRYVPLNVVILIKLVTNSCSSIKVSESKMDANVTQLFQP